MLASRGTREEGFTVRAEADAGGPLRRRRWPSDVAGGRIAASTQLKLVRCMLEWPSEESIKESGVYSLRSHAPDVLSSSARVERQGANVRTAARRLRAVLLSCRT